MRLTRISLAAFAATLLAGTALAADLPSRKAPVLAPVPVFTWSGFYVGAQVGYAGGKFRTFEDAGGFPTGFGAAWNGNGVVGGLHAGFNWQVNMIVAGLEGDVEGASTRGTAAYLSGVPGGAEYGAFRNNVRGSLRGRAGLAFDRALLYATGGVTFANFRTTIGTIAGIETMNIGRTGYTVGAGLEYAFTPNWSARVEYRYSDYGKFTQGLLATFPGFTYREQVTEHSVRGGLSYHFTWLAPAPVVAKY